MSNAIVAAEKWLYGVLTADGTLAGLVATRVYFELIPDRTPYPYIYATMPGAEDDLQTLEARRIWSVLPYVVRYVDNVESYTLLEPGAAAIESTLTRASGSNVSGVIMASIYRRPFKMTEIAKDGFLVCQLGGFYDLYVQ